MFQEEETMVAEDTTGSTLESAARDDDVIVLTPIAKTDFRLTIEPSVILLILGAYINCKYRLIVLNYFVHRKPCLV